MCHIFVTLIGLLLLNLYNDCEAVESIHILQKRQAQTEFQATFDTGSLLNLASGLQNIFNRVQQATMPGQFQFNADFGANTQRNQNNYNKPPGQFGPPGGRRGYGPPRGFPDQQGFEPPGHSGFGPPGQSSQHFGPPGFGRHPPPSGPPGFGGHLPPHEGGMQYEQRPSPPPIGAPINQQQNNNPQSEISGDFGKGNPGTILGPNQDKDKNNIVGYLDGGFPVILLDDNEIRR